ncbi:unnamed protein product [Effrenium voratum]|nr:unnamed protein product [Effrenium voratum]
MQLSQGSLLGEDCIHGFGKNGDDASASGVPLDVVEEDATPSMARSSASPALRRCLGGFSKWMGKDHGTGAIYGFVNWIVCVPSLVSYAHIVFPQHEFREFLPSVVKIFFLSSAVMQVAMTLLSEIQFAIGQIQDVGLIFLAGMVRNIVHMGHADRAVSSDGLMATSMWTCFCSTFVVGFALIAIGALKMIQYVQMLPLPVVGGYLGYIGYFCFAAGLAIGTGKEVNGPETLLQLWDHTLLLKESLLFIFAAVMIFVHFKARWNQSGWRN